MQPSTPQSLSRQRPKTIEFGLLLNVVYDDQTGMALFTGNEDTVIELSGGIEFALQFPPTQRDMWGFSFCAETE